MTTTKPVRMTRRRWQYLYVFVWLAERRGTSPDAKTLAENMGIQSAAAARTMCRRLVDAGRLAATDGGFRPLTEEENAALRAIESAEAEAALIAASGGGGNCA